MLTSVIRRAAIACLLLTGSLSAEPPAAAAGPLVQGKVMDASRTPIPGATVTASPAGRASGIASHSGPNGDFTLSLPPGAYTLQVAADGFEDLKQSLEVTQTPPAALELILRIAPRQDIVTVTDTANYQILTSSSLKTSTPLLDVPQSVAIVTQDLIRDQNMMSMADVVRYVPGVTMAQGEGHRDAPVIRGNATTADFYVNGVRDDVQYFRDLYNVEGVEAVKGSNALTFGRGGGGGVINRVTKEAQFFPLREIALQGGTFGAKRFTTDFGQSINDKLAFRINGVYENSDSFRHFVNAERYGFAPTVTIKPGELTKIRLGYEYFNDGRTVDRGIPSFAGTPAPIHRSTFFGDPNGSYSTAGVNLGSVIVEHQAGLLNIRNNTLFGHYDKFYQNIFAGAVNPSKTLVAITGYANATERQNIFNQTDVTGVITTGPIRHTLLMGAEFGRQHSINFRSTAFFENGSTSLNVPFLNPAVQSNAVFRQAAADADNYATNHVASTYIQDQIELNRYVQVVAGVRYDSFNIDFHNNRNNENLSRRDNMVSPRAGVVLKPIAPVSLYASYSVSYLPSSGDQFSSLTATSQTLRPEKFSNYEIGAKWDVYRYLSLTTAVYRLDRNNTTARDPNDPSRTVQTGSQRTNGYEFGLNGNLTRKWRVVGGYSYQDAFISSATLAAARGAKVPIVPSQTFSLWNNYRILPRLGGGLGVIHQAEMFTGIDNTVTLPSFTRADAALYFTLTEEVRLQANVENLFDRTYFPTAHSNNNITPGYARAARIGLIARF